MVRDVFRHLFLFNQIVIKKITYILLLVLLWVLLIVLMPFFANSQKISPESYSEQFVVAMNMPNAPKSLKSPWVESFDPCSCISYAKAITSNSGQIWGNANKLTPNAHIPWPGLLVLLDEGNRGHVAVIKKVEGTTLTITESNYLPCEVSERTIEIFDERILGYRTV